MTNRHSHRKNTVDEYANKDKLQLVSKSINIVSKDKLYLISSLLNNFKNHVKIPLRKLKRESFGELGFRAQKTPSF